MEASRQARVAVLNLGCKVNRYESDAVAQRFVEAGYEEVPFDRLADVYVLNTCAVTGEAARKSGQLLRRARKKNPEAVVVAMGCHVELGGETAVADVIVGNQGKSRVFEAVDYFRRQWAEAGFLPDKRPAAIDLSQELSQEEGAQFEDFGLVDHQSETRAYLKIQDGCNNFCSYCAIPFARGRVRSRAEASVLQEAEALAARGFKEVVLTGIHVCSYGKDWGEDSLALAKLCQKIATIPGIERIRLGSLEPLSVSEAFVDSLATIPEFCPHFHLSLQSGSEAVLRLMRRRYTAEQYRQVVQKLKATFGERLGLTTDVIVGFPGEDEACFEESLAFCEEMDFLRMHIFRYSERAGTAAVRLPNKVAAEVSARRSMRMAHLAEHMQQKHLRARLGQEESILLEQQKEAGLWEGYSARYEALLLADPEGRFHQGELVRGRILELRGDRLLMEPL